MLARRSILHALERRTLFASPGSEWNDVAVGGNGLITGIVYSPAQANLAFARTDNGGAFRWDQADDAWSPLMDWARWDDAPARSRSVETLAVDPTDANRVYMAVGSDMGPAAIFRSSDQGLTWLRTDVAGINADGAGPARTTGERISVDPNSPNILYYGTRDDGLWKSVDHGETWNNVASFPTTGEDSGFTADAGVVWVLFDKASATPGNPTQTIYAGVVASTAGVARIYRSTNAGASWHAMPGAQPTGANYFPQRAALSNDGSSLYVTYGQSTTSTGPGGLTGGLVYRASNPSGNVPSWTNITPVASPAFGFSGIAIDPVSQSTIYVTELGNVSPADRIWKSSNSGGSWQAQTPNTSRDDSAAPYASALALLTVGDLKVDPFNRNVAMFASGFGVYRTTNLTNTSPTWTFFNAGLEQSSVTELISPNSGDVHLLSAMIGRDGFRHNDFGASPTIGRHGQNTGMSRGTSDDIDVAWNDSNRLVRTTRVSPWVQYSNDNGVTWSSFPASGSTGANADGASIAISADGTKAVYEPAGSGRVRYSTRTGSSWSGWSLPATNQPTDGATIVADLVAGTTFYAFDDSTVWRTTNGGANWSVMTTSSPGFSSVYKTDWVRAVPGQSGHLLLSRGSNGLWRSIDAGATWAQLGAGVVAVANQVAVGASAPGESYPAIFVGGTVNGQPGFHRSDDEGATWIEVSDSAHQFGDVTTLQGDPRIHGRLYVGTSGRGIVYADLIQSPTPPVATIAPLSPNPLAAGVASFTITFDQPVSGFDLADLTLSRDGSFIALDDATLVTTDSITWTLSGTSSLTGKVGSYMITIVASGSGIVGASSLAMEQNESESWVMNAIVGSGSTDDIRLSRSGASTDFYLGDAYQYSFNHALLPELRVLGNAGDDRLSIVGDASDESVAFDAANVSAWLPVAHDEVERFAYDGVGGVDDLSIDAVRVESLASTAVFGNLSMTPTATLDLGANAAVVHHTDLGSWTGSTYTGLAGLLALGRNSGLWNGFGITSSAVQPSYTSIGIASATEVLGIGPSDTTFWRGQTAWGDSVLLRYTYEADADLSGYVDIDDYGLIDFNASTGGALTGHFNGDFDLSGLQDIDDYGLIDFIINIQSDPL